MCFMNWHIWKIDIRIFHIGINGVLIGLFSVPFLLDFNLTSVVLAVFSYILLITED